MQIFVGTGRYFSYKKGEDHDFSLEYRDFSLEDMNYEHSPIIKEIITKLDAHATSLRDFKQEGGLIRLSNHIGSIPTVASLSFQYI